MFTPGSREYVQALLVLSVSSTATAHPSGNIRALPPRKIGWQSGPQERGTFDLLLSCVTTLSLCAWTAYHPNVPTGRSAWRKIGHRLVWMGIAVVMPEVVLWCAWEQWWVAKQLMDNINRKVPKDNESGKEKEPDAQGKVGCPVCDHKDADGANPDQAEETATGAHELENVAIVDEGQDSPPVVTASNAPSRSPSSSHRPSKQQSFSKPNPPSGSWTLSQSFFALSGGYALPSPHPNYPPLTLTPAGILLLLRLNILPPTSPSAISDKSKADGIAKALVCLQAGWFIVQMVARAAAKLPITTLEIHVLAHVLYAFAIYAVWFQKGYDVGEPILIESEEGKDMGALFALSGDLGIIDHRNKGRRVVDKCACGSPPIDPALITPTLHRPMRHSTAQYWRKLLYEFDMQRKPKGPILDSLETFDRESPQYPRYLAQVERANRALRLLKSYNEHLCYGEEEVGIGEDSRKYISMVGGQRNFIVQIRSDFAVQGIDRDIAESRGGLSDRQVRTYSVISIVYGALHLLALSPTHFPTRIEYYFWLSSTVSMLVAPFCFVIVIHDPFNHISAQLRNHPSPNAIIRVLQWAANTFLSTVTLTLYALTVLSATCYLFARPYVLVEGLAGLRAVDARIYETVQWTSFIPHAG